MDLMKAVVKMVDVTASGKRLMSVLVLAMLNLRVPLAKN
jgi:hypothetical protein